MSLCWLAPAQRPSLRELRIMLLHLRYSREESDASALAEFDRKWNQLMPRKGSGVPLVAPVIVDSDDDSDVALDFALDDKTARTSASSAAPDGRLGMLPSVHNAGGLGAMMATTGAIRPASFDSEFSTELNASLLAQAGSLQASLRSFSSSMSNTPDDLTVGDVAAVFSNGAQPRYSSAANEMSLAAEIGAMNDSSVFEIVPSIAVAPDEKQQLGGDVGTMTGSTDTLSEVRNGFQAQTANDKSPGSKNLSSDSGADGFVVDDEEWHGFSGSPLPSVDERGRPEELSANNTNAGKGLDENVGQLSVTVGVAKDSPDSASNGSREAMDESFLVLGSPSGSGFSQGKSAELASPTKSTTSSADWCVVSSAASEHSKDDDFERSSRNTDHGLLVDASVVPAENDLQRNDHQQQSSPVSDAGIPSSLAQESDQAVLDS